MLVIIRVDASSKIGTGHVVRCLTLAVALRQRDAEVVFICREHTGHIFNIIEGENFELYKLPAQTSTTTTFEECGNNSHASWLGVPWQEDAKQTLSLIDTFDVKPDWLIVDHYALDFRWEVTIRNKIGKLMVIDDLADRNHECDYIVDQNLVADYTTRYTNKIPVACVALLGPKYALLQPDYASLHDRTAPRKGAIKRILVFFGGADTDNLVGRTISAFLRLNRSDLEMDVVVVASKIAEKSLQNQIKGAGNVRIISGLKTLAHHISNSDLGIGASGTTNWERCCLGLPSLVITLAENQKAIAKELHKRKLIKLLGHKDVVSTGIIEKNIRTLICDGLSESWSLRCRNVVDGLGVQRVCNVLNISASSTINIRVATLADEKLLLDWANDTITRQNAFNSNKISLEDHHKWFVARIKDLRACHMYVIETADKECLGQVRFERMSMVWGIDYAVSPLYRGRGLGAAILKQALFKLRSDEGSVAVIGNVKPANISSCKVFETIGFQKCEKDEIIEYRYEL